MAHRQLTLTHGRIFPLTRETIAARLAAPAPAPEAHDLHIIALKEGTPVTEAAVLVPLVNRDGRVQVLFTQRTVHLDDHAGQISFPGGRVEAGDASREETALREAGEEIGLERGEVALLGRLPDYDMPSGFRITPVVGWIEPPLALRPDPLEVADIFEAPLEHFLDARNYQRREYRFRGRHRHYMAIPFEGRYIWGATAGMLFALCRALRN
ncbi:MAG: CoA pyrophosphatase [Betaproteobacteria bacterium]|nr:CoA pyrophosphatase [Betaproteobacteria bacterium]